MLNSWHIEFAHGIITRYILTQGYMRKSTGERMGPWSKYTRVPFFAPVYYWLHHTLTNEHVVNLNTRENSTVETRIPVKLIGIENRCIYRDITNTWVSITVVLLYSSHMLFCTVFPRWPMQTYAPNFYLIQFY